MLEFETSKARKARERRKAALKQYGRNHAERLKKEGRCRAGGCYATPHPGSPHCPEHRAKIAKRRRERYLKSLGIEAVAVEVPVKDWSLATVDERRAYD